MTRNRSGAVLKVGPPGLELSLASKLLEDAYGQVAASHGKRIVRLGHWGGHKIKSQIEYGIKHKFYNEKGMTAISLGISAPIVIGSVAGSVAITGATKGVATPLALAGLAAGTWAANQVADAVTELIRNQFRKKRMRKWLDNYPKARSKIEHAGERLLLIQDTCDSIRRAVDHYRKASGAARDLGREIAASQQGQFTNCSELTTLVKRQMKFLHEVQKTELYLIPALDLGILLKNTQRELCEAWGRIAPQYREGLGTYLLVGDHSRCGKVCYGSAGGPVPEPRKPLKSGSAPEGNGIMRLGEKAQSLQQELDGLVALREAMGADLQATIDTGGNEPNTSAKQRFDALLEDAAQHYDNPGVARRSAHYVRNAWTRRTRGELVMGAVNRGGALAMGMATAAGGNVFNTQVVAPHIVTPLNGLIKIPDSVVHSLQFGLVDPLSDAVGSAAHALPGLVSSVTGSAVKTGVVSTAKVGWLGARIGTGVAVDKALDKGPEEATDYKITEAGKAAGDNLFKKSVRHLQQASDIFKKVTEKSHSLATCEDALDFGSDVGQFVWHMQKSMRYLDKALQLVQHMANGVTRWNGVEPELWVSIQRVSLHYLSWGCGNCACSGKPSGACYAPGSLPNTPKRRM